MKLQLELSEVDVDVLIVHLETRRMNRSTAAREVHEAGRDHGQDIADAQDALLAELKRETGR